MVLDSLESNKASEKLLCHRKLVPSLLNLLRYEDMRLYTTNIVGLNPDCVEHVNLGIKNLMKSSIQVDVSC